ncbi:MAG TPA: flagellar motor switch protein FliG, partial [Dermatophilaceae bacterium]
ASAQVLKSLQQPEIEELTAEIARLEAIDPDVAEHVLGEFKELAVAHHYFAQGGLKYAEEVLEATLGADKAREIMLRQSALMVEMPFEFLRQIDPQMVLSFLQDEHPQTITLVLAHMDAQQAAAVLSGLPEAQQAEVAHRLAVMDRTSPDIVKQVESQLHRRISTVFQGSESSTVGGLTPLVEIINHSDRNTERLILEGLEARDPQLAEDVRARMFMFEDVRNLEDRMIQILLRNIDIKELAVALKGVAEDVRGKFMNNLSERAALGLREDMDVLGPVRVKQVEEAQAGIIRQIRALEESGEIVISQGDGDDFVS